MTTPRQPVDASGAVLGRRGGGAGEPAPQQVPARGDDTGITDRHLITVEDAARRLSIARSNVYRFLERGELPSVKLGRCRRIAVEDLNEFVRRLRVRAGIV